MYGNRRVQMYGLLRFIRTNNLCTNDTKGKNSRLEKKNKKTLWAIPLKLHTKLYLCHLHCDECLFRILNEKLLNLTLLFLDAGERQVKSNRHEIAFSEQVGLAEGILQMSSNTLKWMHAKYCKLKQDAESAFTFFVQCLKL